MDFVDALGGFLEELKRYLIQPLLVVINVFVITRWIAHRRRPFDPQWLIALAKSQCPEEPWLPEALARCTSASYRGIMIYFVSPRRPNMAGSAWQYDYSIELDHPEYGFILLDILKGQRIGAVEFVAPPQGAKINQAGRMKV